MIRPVWLTLAAVLALGGVGAALRSLNRVPVVRDQVALDQAAVPPSRRAPTADAPSAEQESGRQPSSTTSVVPERSIGRRPSAWMRGPRHSSTRPSVRPTPTPAIPPSAGPLGDAGVSRSAARGESGAANDTASAAASSDPAVAAPPAPVGPPGLSPAPPVPPPAAPVITPPVPLSLEPPRHPLAWRVVVEAPGLVAEARPEHVTARVRLRLLVRVDGTVGSVEVAVSSGRADLDDTAARAAGAWRFAPARRDGTPIDSRVLIWVSFVLEP